MAIENFLHARHSLAYGAYHRAHGWAWKKFQIEVLRHLENAILNLVFATNRAILIIKVC